MKEHNASEPGTSDAGGPSQRSNLEEKYGPGNVVLIPQPSNSSHDPLNWPIWKKCLLLFTLCLSAWAASLAAPAAQLAFIPQTVLYHKSPTDLSYAVSSGIAGLLAGPIVFVPLANVIGRTSVLFWGLIATIACQIWAALMTGPDDYIPFVISRLMCGLFSGPITILGPGYIMDIFFLHQRGKAFACYEVSFLFGVIGSPSIGGFIAEIDPWPVAIWWTLAPLSCAAIMVFFVGEETHFDRDGPFPIEPDIPRTFIRNRIATLLPGTRVAPPISRKGVLKRFLEPFIIGLAPVTVISGLYTFVTFGFAVLTAVELSIFLQIPVEVGGYGFSPYQNGLFTFSSWLSLVAAQLIGFGAGDRIPLLFAKRRQGIWQPELRLWNMLFPIIVAPIGLAVIGVGLQYHLHYMVLALGSFLIGVAAQLAVPLLINYVVECFVSRSVEVAIALNVYRLALALSLEFFFQPWTQAVGDGWTFGMAAFFTLAAGLLVLLLLWKGSKFRQIPLLGDMSKTEDGAQCCKTDGDTESSRSR